MKSSKALCLQSNAEKTFISTAELETAINEYRD